MKPDKHDFAKPSEMAGELEQRLSAWFKMAGVMAPKKWASLMPFQLGLSAGGLDTIHPQDALSHLPAAPVAYRVMLQENVATLLVFPRTLASSLLAGMLGDRKGSSPGD